MPDCAAFLRGVNLGPHRRVSSAELRSIFEELGFAGVGTFRSSGNVVFDAGPAPLEELKPRVEEGLEAALGFDVEVFLRTGDEIRAIAGHQPFEPQLVESSNGKLQVSLLSSRPAAGVRRDVLALATEHDRLAFGERELYWLPSGGLLESELDLAAIDSLLGSLSRRTKGTMDLLAAKFF